MSVNGECSFVRVARQLPNKHYFMIFYIFYLNYLIIFQ